VKKLLCSLVLGVFLTACGSPSANPPAQVDATTEPGVGVPPVDWENPIAGIEVPGLLAAQKLLPFEVYTPQLEASPFKVLVTDPAKTSLRDMVLALMYHTSNYGLVVIKEHNPDVPIDQYDTVNLELLAQNGQPGTHGSFELVPVRAAAKALVTTSEDQRQSSIFFLEGSIEIVIRGPELDRTDVIELANRI
jgi:hypothetical protein